MVLVEFLYRFFEFLTLLSTNQELCYFGAALLIFGANLSQSFSLHSRAFRLVNRPERILGELALMFVLSELGFRVPYLALFLGKVLPSYADNL